ncbi:hypothetical protein HU200_060006 [Digitaria exilis]|uniref:Uncharacterized protein n=1 Tax=Digitaria exilis TaxID=1010633 RepID=A0A835E2L1_9POAL|nr:hypothetical protein HU200_060006 [Digitaria exilis]
MDHLAQALEASAKLSHLCSLANPDAVLAYLESTLDNPAANVTRVVVIDRTFLCADVERNLALRVTDVHDLGPYRVPSPPRSHSFRIKFLRSNIDFSSSGLQSSGPLTMLTLPDLLDLAAGEGGDGAGENGGAGTTGGGALLTEQRREGERKALGLATLRLGLRSRARRQLL